MATGRLRIGRDQLASFLKDHEAIRQFERLFTDVEQLEPTTLADIILTLATAENKAGEALDAVEKLRREIELSVPRVEQPVDALDDPRIAQLVTQIDDLRKQVDALQSAPPPREFKRARYGSFYDTTTQTATAINTAKAITFNTTDLSSGVRIGTTTSQVIVDTEGVYNFQTSIQLDSTVSVAHEFYLWFRLNGVDVTNSASQVRIQGNNAEVFLALNYFFNLKANDYVELMFSVTDLGVRLEATAASAPHPGIPSVILTVSNNIQGVQ
jgi:hypothetical protein